MALVTTGEFDGAIVDTKTVGRPVGDTSSSACYVTDLPKNFIGGDEALHFALGEVFGQYGKIKKIELYMEEGILETQNFKGEALVVFHTTKKTGIHDKGDPVYEACTDMDGKWRLLGKRGWRIRCEAAVWQKDGFDVKTKVKVYPCVEISNLWEYDPSQPMSYFAEVQEGIRKHAAEHIEQPFVKVEPSAGTATIWCKGAQDAMKFASMMHKSYFLGRKVTTALCRKERPVATVLPKIKVGHLTMELPTAVWDGSGVIPGTETRDVPGPAGPQLPEFFTAAPEGEFADEAPKATADEALAAEDGSPAPLKKGCKVKIHNLVSKPENNGKLAVVVDFMEDLGRYQVSLDGRLVKLKIDNLILVEDPSLSQPKKKRARPEEEDPETAEAEASKAFDAAANMAAGNVRHGPEHLHDVLKDGFLATVCVDPALLPKREEVEDPEVVEARARRERSRSRGRRQEERISAAKARLEAEGGPRPSWVVPSPAELAAKMNAEKGGTGGGAAGAANQPEESREELMKLSVGKLKEMLVKFGKTARGALEKKDFVDRLKPPPKEA